MNFTRDDILKIQRALQELGIKDSEFPEAYTPISEDDTISIVLGGSNKKINVQDFISQLGFLHNEDFLNITDRYDESYITLSEAIKLIPERKRKVGLVISFQDTNGDWRIYLFRGDITLFNNETLWKDLYDFTEYIVDSILPDEEDITKVSIDDKGNYVTKFKDKEYDPENFSGMATKILRKHIIEIDDPELGKVKKNILYQDDFNLENCIYEIRYDFDLNNLKITIPNNCILKFNGGSLSNGTIVGNNTIVDALFIKIFDLSIKLDGTWKGNFYIEWIGANPNSTDDSSLYFQWLVDTDIVLDILLIDSYYIKKDIIVDRKNTFILKGKNKNINYIYTSSTNVFTIKNVVCIHVENITFKSIDINENTFVFYGTISSSYIHNCLFMHYGSIFDIVKTLTTIQNNNFYLIRKHFIYRSITDSVVKSNYINGSRFNHSWAIREVNGTEFINNFIDFWKYFYIHSTYNTNGIFVGNLFDNIFRVIVGGSLIVFTGNVFSNIEYTKNSWEDRFLDEDMKTKPWAIVATQTLISEFPDDVRSNLFGRFLNYVNFSNNTGHSYNNILYCESSIYQPHSLNISDNKIKSYINDTNFTYVSANESYVRTYKNIFIDILMYKEYDSLPNPIINSTSSNNVTFNRLIIKVDNLYYINIDGVWNKYKEANTIKGTTSKRPILTQNDINYLYYDTTLNKEIMWNGTEWVNKDSSSLNNNGTTENRPTTALQIGFIYKDTTLNKLIIWEGSKWVNIDGTDL